MNDILEWDRTNLPPLPLIQTIELEPPLFGVIDPPWYHPTKIFSFLQSLGPMLLHEVELRFQNESGARSQGVERDDISLSSF